jgi:hypothetical protein
MSLDRRGFLKSLLIGGSAAAVTAVLDPEKLLWIPGQKTFFIPEMVKPKNLRLATEKETADLVTGQHMVRIKYWEALPEPGKDDRYTLGTKVVQKITLMTEAEFAKNGHNAFPSGEVEVHFDNGTVAYSRNGLKASDLPVLKSETYREHQEKLRIEREYLKQRQQRDLGAEYWAHNFYSHNKKA